jgi:hypothetical protein
MLISQSFVGLRQPVRCSEEWDAVSVFAQTLVFQLLEPDLHSDPIKPGIHQRRGGLQVLHAKRIAALVIHLVVRA